MNIEKFEKMNEEEKLQTCWDISYFVTLNGIDKETLHHIFKWLVGETMEEAR